MKPHLFSLHPSTCVRTSAIEGVHDPSTLGRLRRMVASGGLMTFWIVEDFGHDVLLVANGGIEGNTAPRSWQVRIGDPASLANPLPYSALTPSYPRLGQRSACPEEASSRRSTPRCTTVHREHRRGRRSQDQCSHGAAIAPPQRPHFSLIKELYGNEISRMVEVGMLIILHCH